MSAGLAIGAAALLAAAAASRPGSAVDRRGSAGPEPAPRFTVEGGEPLWDLTLPRDGEGPPVRVLLPLDGRGPERVPRAWPPGQPEAQALRRARRSLLRSASWLDHLAALPVDWSRPTYLRIGQWGGASRCFLRGARQQLCHGGDDHERLFEVGVSVLRTKPTPSGWRVEAPDRTQALYGLHRDYISQLLAARAGQPLLIVQGEPVMVVTQGDELEGEALTPALGADGEPLLEPRSLRVVDQPEEVER